MKPNWIPVSMGKPEPYRLVLVKFAGSKYFTFGPICVAYWKTDYFVTPGQRARHEIGLLTHWADCLGEGFSFGKMTND